jgi:hypothetical protein
MGSTRYEAPEIIPVDIAQSLRDSAIGYRDAAPDIILAEETLRPAMQKLALADAKIALLGGTPELREERDAAQAALDAQTTAKSEAESAIRANIATIENRKFDVAAQKAKWETAKRGYETYEKDTKNLIKVSEDQDALEGFKRDNPQLWDNRGNFRTTARKSWSDEVVDAHEKVSDILTFLDDLPAGTLPILENFRKSEDTTGPEDEQRRLGEIQKGLERSIETVTTELAGTDAEISAYKREEFEGETKLLADAEYKKIDQLAQSELFGDAEIERLRGDLQKASDAVLEDNPGMLDLAEYAVERQGAVGEKLKRAAAENEFHTIQELAPELVEMYREADPGSVELADLASKRAQQMIDRPERGYSEQQTAMKQLRKDVGLAPVGGPLGADVERETRDLLGQGAITTPTPAMQAVRAQIGGLIKGPAQSYTEKALHEAGRAAPAGATQAEALSDFGIGQLAATATPAGAAETALLAAAQRPTEATGLAQFGTDQLAAIGRTASPVETALGTAAESRLNAQQREARAGLTPGISAEEAIAQRGLSMLEQPQVDPETGRVIESPTQTQMRALAQEGMEATLREPGEGSIEEALGMSAMRGMDAQQRAASPEQIAMQARIGELIGGAGTLSPLEQRQVQQEMLTIQQRQGTIRNTAAAAAVANRMAEARRADLGQDLGLASNLLGQQDALTQAAIQEQLQRVGMGQQGAVSAAGLESARQQELLNRQAQGMQAGMTAEQMELARQQQGIATAQAGAGMVSGADALQQARFQQFMAEQQAGAGMAGTAGQMEAQRVAELQAQQGMGMQAAGQAGSLGLQGQQQQLSALGYAGDLEAQRLASLQAQRGMGAQALGQSAGLGLQGGAQQLAAMQSAAEQQAQRQAQRLQGVGIAGGIAQQQFGQMAAGRELEMRQLGVGAGIAGDLAAQQRQQQTLMSGLLGQEQQAEERRVAQNVAREQQGMGALGGAFGMSKAVAPDVGAFFGRPASQAEGLGVLGMGQQQAQYGATPKGADYGVGLNMAMAQQANQAELDAAAIGASGSAQGGLMSGIGSVAGSIFGGPIGGSIGGAIGGIFDKSSTPASRTSGLGICWVAREVYGHDNPMWLLFREWILNESPSWFRNLYIKHGERFAAFISNKPFIKKLIRKWMTSIVRKHYG